MWQRIRNGGKHQAANEKENERKNHFYEMDKVKCMYAEMFRVSVFNSFALSFSFPFLPFKYVKFGHVYHGKGRTTHPHQPYTSFFTHFQIIQACFKCEISSKKSNTFETLQHEWMLAKIIRTFLSHFSRFEKCYYTHTHTHICRNHNSFSSSNKWFDSMWFHWIYTPVNITIAVFYLEFFNFPCTI